MNNKVKTIVKQSIRPKFRFPEFQTAQEWEIKLLGDLIYYENGKAHEQNISDAGKYIVVNSKFISTDGEIKKFTNDGLCIANKGDILMVLSDVPNGKAIAKCFLVEQDNLYTVNQRICLIKPKNSVGEFIFYIINRNPFYLNFDDGIKQTNLRKDDVLSCPIIIPSSKNEQQKIADCLSSIDELITAESKKLNVLKTYKKGLMQQLFPAEYEILPKLRFSEFQKDFKNWKKASIEEMISDGILLPPQDGNHGNIHPKSSDYVDSGIPFIMASDIQSGKIDLVGCSKIKKCQAELLKKGFAKEGDVLLTHKGTIGEVALVEKIESPYLMLTPQVTYYRINDMKKLYNKFLAYVFSSHWFQGKMVIAAGGGTRAYIGITEQRKLQISLPINLTEQIRIADFLLSLDDLITNQSKKIETFKSHKKGLMQQLYPSARDIMG